MLPAGAEDLTSVLARMDASSANFRSLTATLDRADYTAILNDTSSESGTIRMLRVKPGDLRVRIDFTRPDPKTVVIAGTKLEIYLPKMSVVQEFDLRKYKNLIDQFLLLGFGAPGRDLARSFTVRLAGSETMNGQTASRLELIPKDPKAREQFNRLELWIGADGHPLRQRFHEPSGDHRTANYSNMKVNQDISADDLTLKLPKGVKREYPQK
jgi:outer membrane lipoprotein-sorting protein